MDRKEFIAHSGWICLGCLTPTLLLQGCKAAFYIPNSFAGDRIAVKKSDFSEHTFVIVKNEQLRFPVYLSRLGEEAYAAVLMQCTHKGCELNAARQYLYCPCHGSQFSHTGKVLQSPASLELKKFDVTTDNENIYIQL